MLKLWREIEIASCRRIFFCGLALLYLWLVPGVAAATTFTAMLDRDTITLGETATLGLTFGGDSSGGQPGPPSMPPIPGLRIDYGGSSRNVAWENGQTTSTMTYNFVVTPTQAGEFTIPALVATVGRTRLQTQPLKLKVLKPGAPPPDAIASGTEPAFLKLVLPKYKVYVGEPIRAEIQLYAREGIGINGMDRTAFPAEGFNLSQQMLPGAQRNARLGAVAYRVLPIQFTLKPVKTGLLSLGPATFNAVVELPTRDRGRDPFFDQFGLRSPFSRGEQKRVVLATESTNVLCLPLPSQNVPPGFNGAVGNYTMSVTAGPTNLMAGDPITLRVRIAGRGALDSLLLPEQPEWRNFKVFAPTAKPLESRDPFGLEGSRTFEQIVVPQSPEIKELPQFSFSFFDPDAGNYRTLTQPAMPLMVRPGGTVAAPTFVGTGRPAQDAPPPAQDIVHIKPRLGALAQAGPPLAWRPWFILLQTVPVLAWVWALAWRKRADRFATNPRLRRRRQLKQILDRGLAEMRGLAAANQSDPFFATLFRLLQEQLGERLDLPASAITEAVIDEHLRPRGVPESVLGRVHELFQNCNLARYAPVKNSQELAALIPKFEATLRELQALPT